MVTFIVGENQLLLLCCVLFAGAAVEALSYDYSAIIQCLAEPLKPQYGGGIIINPDLNHGLHGWHIFGHAKIENRLSSDGGNSFMVAHSRNHPSDSFSQKLYLLKGRLYTFSAWVQVVEGNVPVTAVFSTKDRSIYAGAVVAESGCWSMLKGGLTVNSSGPAELYFETKNTTVEIWVDSVSLQPFTKKQWRTHQDQSVQKLRKRKVRFQAVDDGKGKTIAGAKVSIHQKNPSFPFGNSITKAILDNPAYRNWFVSRFTVTTFENEMKWYSTENFPGKEDYSVADAMLSFAKQFGIAVRGHNVFWDDPKYQPAWVKSLSPDQLREAAAKRIDSVVSRYKGQLIAWDVVNENLHFSFFEDKLGKDASAAFYQRAHQLDGGTTMFMNEYNTIEDSRDQSSTPAKYLQKLREIQSTNPGKMGIGVESHFSITPNIPYMRSSLDVLAAAKLPLWITELDIESMPNQAQYLEEILREAHSHPAINGIVMWAAWHPEGCNKTCLTDENFRNLPAGDVVDKLINEWRHSNLVLSTDTNGSFEVSLFHGDYDITMTHPSMNSTLTHSFKVPTGNSETLLHFHVHDR
ncbi:endo-1,4-beta-xylanase 5-like [Macadamia integrifolia]|uniref:endo-1,4-beta-xylanase 5-like n=1 Tax=Macadamia integrifolia TaxID=60698 RepID=UPI001C4FD56D|nr:endo-1,4-beta-xylanase 5-like [Macadamia integrifolia]XP_042491363.1 endo-1,4-beta-xylanase 5-like [Macadamia integrifolia]